jgi:hypothetical protein
MNDAGVVCFVEAADNLTSDVERVGYRHQRTTLQSRLEGLAFVKGHGDEKLPVVGLANFIDRADIWMIESGGGLRLLHEPLTRFVFVGSREVGREKFQRHAPFQAHVLGAVHHAHSAPPEMRQDPVVGNDVTYHRFLRVRAGDPCGQNAWGRIHSVLYSVFTTQKIVAMLAAARSRTCVGRIPR